MAHTTCLVVTFALALAGAAPAHAQAAAPAQGPASAAYVGRPVVAVRMVTEGRPTSAPDVLDLVQTAVGAPLAMTAVRATIAHLFSLRRFQDVQVDAREVEGGVELTYNLIPLHAVERVDFRGDLGLSEGLLRGTVTSRFGASPPVGRAAEAARMLEDLYREQGYLRATVAAEAIEEHDPERTLLTFDVAAGPRARIRSVDVIGEPGDRAGFLKRVGAAPGSAYEPARLAEALNSYADNLRKAGRYEATAGYRASVSEDRTQVDLTIDVQPGPVVTLRFEGDPLPSDRVDDLVPMRREMSAHEDLIEDAERRIAGELGQQGYWKASVTSRSEEADGQRVVIFTVRRGLQYRIAQGIDVTGASAISMDEIRPLLARLQADSIFVSANLDGAAGAIEAMYRGRGYAQVRVTAAANELNPTPAGTGQVKPVIAITEGPQTLLGAVGFDGNAQLTTDRLQALITARPGMPYIGPRLNDDRERVLLAYLNEGFAAVDLQMTPVISADGTRADVTFRIAEGPQTIVDHILIVGNSRTSPDVIRRELLFQPGEALGLADLIESRRRLSALGLFRRVAISELSHGSTGLHDVLVTVEESPRTTLSYGGGLEASRRVQRSDTGSREDRIEFAPRGFFDIGRRNLGGKNRSVNLYTRLSLRPENDTADGEGGRFSFTDYRVVGTYREPSPFKLAGDFTLTGAVEQGVRPTFNFSRRGITTELQRRVTAAVRVTARYSLSTTEVSDARVDPEEQVDLDRLFPQVRLAIVSGAISHDSRDDLLEPTRGMFLSAEGSIAARALGGQVGFLKGYGQALWFRRLPGRRGIVFASRAALGLADGFPRTVEEIGPDGAPIETVIEDLPASERFFAGGSTTIRGFALDGVGTPATLSPEGFPLGGNAVLILNGEVRVPVFSSVALALFVDGGNVFDRASNVDLGEIRASTGFGLRYRSPVGPLRVDIGFKIDGQPNPPGQKGYGWHFSFGQAF